MLVFLTVREVLRMRKINTQIREETDSLKDKRETTNHGERKDTTNLHLREAQRMWEEHTC